MKKIIIYVMLATTMILTVSIVSAINTTKITQKDEESPLYRIRTNRAINEKIQNIKTKFFGSRLFYLPFIWQNILINQNQYSTNSPVCRTQGKDTYCPTDCQFSCQSGCTDKCTSGATALCGICTKGIICSTLFDKC